MMNLVRRARPDRRLLAIMAIGAMAVVLGACTPRPASAPSATSTPGLVNEINAQRAANGRGPLAIDAGLTDIASGWAAHLNAIGALQHQNLNAIPFWSALGETVEVGPCGQSDQEVVAAWMASPSHHDVLLSAAFSAVGVATTCGADGREWVVADFGG